MILLIYIENWELLCISINVGMEIKESACLLNSFLNLDTNYIEVLYYF